MAVDTPAAAAICSNVDPVASSSTIRATSGPVSLLGPFGPERSRTNPTTPPRVTADVHRHNVATLTPNADATSTAGAILVTASCTAARRRPASSPAPKLNVANPKTNTTPPSGPSNNPAAGPTEHAWAGSRSSTG